MQFGSIQCVLLLHRYTGKKRIQMNTVLDYLILIRHIAIWIFWLWTMGSWKLLAGRSLLSVFWLFNLNLNTDVEFPTRLLGSMLLVAQLTNWNPHDTNIGFKFCSRKFHCCEGHITAQCSLFKLKRDLHCLWWWGLSLGCWLQDWRAGLSPLWPEDVSCNGGNPALTEAWWQQEAY